MKRFATLALGAAAVFCANAAQAGTKYTTELVTEIDLTFPGAAAVITVENGANNKHVSNVDLEVQQNDITFTSTGSVTCKKQGAFNSIDFLGATLWFGPLAHNGFGNVISTATLTDTSYNPAVDDHSGVVEAMGEYDWVVPLNAIKNGHPAIRVDPIAEVEAMLQKHIQGGGDPVDFYRNNQETVIQRPLSLSAQCNKTSLTDYDTQVGYVVEDYTIQIKYVGDPEVFETPQLNAQLQGGGLANEVNQDLPFKLEQATFQPNMPHHIGKCAPDQDPTIRINLQASGGKIGQMDLIVEENGTPVYGTAGIIMNPENGGSHLDFKYPLKAKLQQNANWNQVNTTFNHNLSIKARYKNMQNGTWSDYKDFGEGLFKHRCTPSLNVNLGNTNGGLGGYQQGGGDQGGGGLAPSLDLNQQQLPEPPSAGTPTQVCPAAQDPEPTSPTRVQPNDPTPEPLTPTRVKPAEVEPETAPARATN